MYDTSTANHRESRVKKTLLNARVNVVFYFLTLALSFFSRKIFLDCLGADFVGLTGTVGNLLSFLNLAELGIGPAIGFLLYKPIFNRDQDSICEIISVMGWFYRWIGLFIMAGGFILSCFLPLIFPQEATPFSYLIIYALFYSYLFSSLIGYFINYRQILLGADQRNYVVTAYFQTGNIIKTILQLYLAYTTRSYLLWVAVEFSFGIIYCVILNWRINKTYPWLRTDIKSGKGLLKKYPDVIKKTRQLFIQKISYFVQYQTVPFLTYAFVSLPTVALYGNYTIVTEKLGNFVNNFLDSTQASIGNLIAEGDTKKIMRLFWELLSMRYFIGGTFAYCILALINPFIAIWLGPEYILSDIVLYLIVINVFIGYVRGGVMQFNFGYGLFADVWAPIAEICINLSIAVICGSQWGLPGILAGGLVSQILIVGIWKPIYLYRAGFKVSVWPYWFGVFRLLFCVAVAALTLDLVFKMLDFSCGSGWIGWITYAAIVFASYAILAFILMYSLTPGMRVVSGRFATIICQRIKRK